MRSLRTTRTTLLLAGLLAVGVAAAPVSPPATVREAAVPTGSRSDSVNVYVVAQVGVTRAIVGDSLAIVAHAQHAAIAVIHGLGVAQIPVVRVGWFVQDFRRGDPTAPTSHSHGAFDSWRSSARYIPPNPRDSTPIDSVSRYASR